MADPWTEAWEEAIAAGETQMPIETLELHHAAFVENGTQVAIRAVNNTEPLSFRLEGSAPLQGGQLVEWTPIPFTWSHPDFQEGTAPQASISVDNIAREVAKYLEAAESMQVPLTVIYRVYHLGHPDEVAFGPFKFIVREVQEVGAAITGRATFANPQNLKFPRKVFTQSEYPALSQTS